MIVYSFWRRIGTSLSTEFTTANYEGSIRKT